MADSAAPPAAAPTPAPAPPTAAAPAEPTPSTSTSSSTSSAPPQPKVDRDARKLIRAGDNVLLKLPSGVLKPVKLNPSSSVALSSSSSSSSLELTLALPPSSARTARSRSASTAPSSAVSSSARPTATRTRSATAAPSSSSGSRSTRSVRPSFPPRLCPSDPELTRSCTRAEETEANNEFIASAGAQTLSFDEIQALKDSGLSGRVRPSSFSGHSRWY